MHIKGLPVTASSFEHVERVVTAWERREGRVSDLPEPLQIVQENMKKLAYERQFFLTEKTRGK